jgi:uncharacterized integral membrane protein
MPEANAAPGAEEKPTLKDKLSSRKFIIVLIGMLANIVLMILGSQKVDEGMSNLFLWGMGFLFCEGGIDAFAALGKALAGSKGLGKILPIIEDLKTLREEIKNNGGGK